jgi:hypothetical protein
LRDYIPEEHYQAASDPHVFYHDGELRMIYTGDNGGNASIKLAYGEDASTWTPVGTLLDAQNGFTDDRNKETAFYRQGHNGKHQIYYIGYPEEDTYEAQVFLAEADALEGPYERLQEPVVPRGVIAGYDVHCITSPSVVEHDSLLYMAFIGWDASPNEVTEVWVLGARSADGGHTWTDFSAVSTPVGMEGQVTKLGPESYVAVRTGDHPDGEAIYYATSTHPFGPWEERADPILIQAGRPYEKDEIIAPQITIEESTGKELLFYTGANHLRGWWVMLAEED